MSKNLTIKNIFKKAGIDHISNISSARLSARQSSNKSRDTLPPDFRVENNLVPAKLPPFSVQFSISCNLVLRVRQKY